MADFIVLKYGDGIGYAPALGEVSASNHVQISGNSTRTDVLVAYGTNPSRDLIDAGTLDPYGTVPGTESWWRMYNNTQIPLPQDWTFEDGTVVSVGPVASYLTDNDPLTQYAILNTIVIYEHLLSDNSATGQSAVLMQISFPTNTNGIQAQAELEALILAHGPVATVTDPGPGTAGVNLNITRNYALPTVAVACFTAGTQIRTADGLISIEDIKAGTEILVADGNVNTVTWAGSTITKLTNSTFKRPIVFAPGSILGNTEELKVSPNHCVVIKGAMAKILFDQDEILVPAKMLVNDKNITIDMKSTEVEYFHFMFDKHEVVFTADGTATESLFVGSESIKGFALDSRKEILSLFPQLGEEQNLHSNAARMVIAPHEATVIKQMLGSHG